MTKTDSADPAIRDNPLEYTLTVENHGPRQARDVELVDTLPGSVSFEAAPASCSHTGEFQGGSVTCMLGTVATGSSTQLTITVKGRDVGTEMNTATVSASTSDPKPSNNVATESTTFRLLQADLTLTKADSADPVVKGDVFQYTLTVGNDGPDEIPESPVVVDALPDKVSFVSASPGCTHSGELLGGTVICAVNTASGTLPVGFSTTLTITVRGALAGMVQNTAQWFFADLDDPDLSNDTATESTTIRLLQADLTLTKSDSADPVPVGDEFDYILTVGNDGPDEIPDTPAVLDQLPDEVSFVSASPGCTHSGEAVGGTVTCTVDTQSGILPVGFSRVLTIRVKADVAGTVQNTAQWFFADLDDPDLSNDVAAESTSIV